MKNLLMVSGSLALLSSAFLIVVIGVCTFNERNQPLILQPIINLSQCGD